MVIFIQVRAGRASHTAAAVDQHLAVALQAEEVAGRAEAEARDLAARDAALEASIASASQSARLLAGVEVQGRAALEQAAREARDERSTFAEKLRTIESKAQANEARLMHLAPYRRMREVEAAVARKREEVEKLRRKRRRLEDVEGSRGEVLSRDREGWMVFRRSVVGVAKAWERGQGEEERLVVETHALEELAGREQEVLEERQEEVARQEGNIGLGEIRRQEAMKRDETVGQEGNMRQEENMLQDEDNSG